MKTIAIHGARSTNAFSARSPEGEGGIQVLFDIEKGIEVHGWYFFEVNIVANILRLVIWVLWIILVD